MRAPFREARLSYAIRAAVLGLAITPLLAHPGLAGLQNIDECRAAVAAAPETAREEAAIWARSGGGVPARLCEAAALEAMGATASAARLLTGLAENPNRAMDATLRATLFRDAARLWLDAGQPDLARANLGRADDLAPPDPDAHVQEARAAAAAGDWPAAEAALEAALAVDPDNSESLTLLAAALRRGGDPEAGLAAARRALALDPTHPAALFEAAAAETELGDTAAARRDWLTLIELYPGHDLAPAARRNLQTLR